MLKGVMPYKEILSFDGLSGRLHDWLAITKGGLHAYHLHFQEF